MKVPSADEKTEVEQFQGVHGTIRRGFTHEVEKKVEGALAIRPPPQSKSDLLHVASGGPTTLRATVDQ